MKIPKRITIKVNLDNVLNEHLYQGKKGKYLNLVLFNTPDNQFGEDYVVKQDIPQDQRPPEVPILGNAKVWEPNGGDTNQMTGAPSNGPAPAANGFGPNDNTQKPFG